MEPSPHADLDTVEELAFWRREMAAMIANAAGLLRSARERRELAQHSRIKVCQLSPMLNAWRSAQQKDWHTNCGICGKPLTTGQMAIAYDDVGSAHANCERPNDDCSYEGAFRFDDGFGEEQIAKIIANAEAEYAADVEEEAAPNGALAKAAQAAPPTPSPAMPSREEIARAMFEVALADVKANQTASRFGYLTKDDINVLADAIAALTSVDRASEADKLRPIETAPKDGSYFLFVGDNFDGGMAVVHWSDDLEWWMLDDGKNFEIPLRHEAGLTGWIPLPAITR